MNSRTRSKIVAACREKTARGNVFVSKAKAKHAASNTTRRVGVPIDWFRCRVCGKYHIGRSNKNAGIEADARTE